MVSNPPILALLDPLKQSVFRSPLRFRLRLVHAAWLVLCLGFVACAGSGQWLDVNGNLIQPDLAPANDVDGGLGLIFGVPAATFSSIQQTLLGPICAAQCHSGALAPQNLQLDAVNAYGNLVGVASAELPSLKRVQPNDPDNSYLYMKIIAGDARRLGVRMPRNGPPYLSNEQIAAVRAWILAGANP